MEVKNRNSRSELGKSGGGIKDKKRAKEKSIAEEYIAMFRELCANCEDRDKQGGECKLSGWSLKLIHFMVEQHFKLFTVTLGSRIPCYHFVDLKDMFDKRLESLPIEIAYERYRAEIKHKIFSGA